jgi:hypothetical protein
MSLSLVSPVAYLLEARTVKSAETAISKERLSEHSVARHWHSSFKVMAVTDAHNNRRAAGTSVSCAVRAVNMERGPAVITCQNLMPEGITGLSCSWGK